MYAPHYTCLTICTSYNLHTHAHTHKHRHIFFLCLVKSQQLVALFARVIQRKSEGVDCWPYAMVVDNSRSEAEANEIMERFEQPFFG